MFEVLAEQPWTVPQAPWWIPLIAPSVMLTVALVLVLARSPWRDRRSTRRRDTQHDAMALTVARDHASELAALRDRQDAETAGLIFSDAVHG